MIEITIRLFNSLSRYADGGKPFSMALQDNMTVGEALKILPAPESEIFLLLHNGRNIMQGYGCNSGIEKEHILEHGDVLAFSGPVPFSRGYGAAVV